MKNPKELMLEFTAFSFRDPKKAAEMFADDGTFEMPYLARFGIPSPYKGRDSIEGFFQFVRDLYPGFQFENIKVLIDTLTGLMEGLMLFNEAFAVSLGY
jgi:hypothetical protein